MAPPTSQVWTYFERKDNLVASCKRCHNTVKYCGNTSNLHKHLKSHNIGLEKRKEISKRKAKEVTVVSEDSCDDVSVVPSDCEAHSIKTVFDNIARYKGDGRKSNNITSSILFFICKDMRPFHVVEGEGFMRLMKEVAPLYKIPSGEYFKTILSNKYDAIMNLYKERIEKAASICITMDIWTETMAEKSFLGVTAHFLEGIDIINCAVATRQLFDRHSAVNISDTLKGIFFEWDINISKIRCIVTDNGPNMVAAVKNILSPKSHLSCFPHTINLVVQAGLDNHEMAAILGKVRTIVKWVKNSVINSDKMRKIQVQHGLSEGSLKKMILDVPTRWNSVYYMVERFLELLKYVSELILETSPSPEIPTGQEIESLKQLLLLLQPFEYITRETSGENYLTMPKIIPMVNCLKTALKNLTFSNPVVTNIAATFILEVNRRFGKIEFNPHAAIATLLDPRFKNLNFEDSLACSQAIMKVRDLIRNDSQVSPGNSKAESSPVNSEFDFWRHHRQLVKGRKSKKETTNSYDELSLYLSTSVSSLKSNPLEEWEEMKSTYPQLYKQARLFLPVVGSSVPCERLFSKAGTTISKARNRLSGKHLEKLLFLGSVPQKLFFS